MKLSFLNTTRWNTKDLRRFVMAGLKAAVGTWHRYRVEIRTRIYNLGRGEINGSWMAIYPPSPEITWSRTLEDGTVIGERTMLFLPADELRIMARTLEHEVLHNRGERHKDMDRSNAQCPIEWCEALIKAGFTIRLDPPKKKTKVDHQAKRASHANKMLEMHEANLKREQKLVRKWRNKVRYYKKALEKKAAKAAKGNENDGNRD